MPLDIEAFRALQSRLAEWWPVLTVRTVPARPRVVVVVSSMTVDVPESMRPMVPAYEERYLCLVLALARSRHTRVVYVTSLPIQPRLAQYHLDLMRNADALSGEGRLTVLSVGDPSARPLTHKILQRPLLIERLRALIGDPRYGLLLPFILTEAEAELAVALGVPAYGPDPAVKRLGSKTGSREVFAAAGVPLPRGAEGLRDRDDIVDALEELQRERPVRRAVVKLDNGFTGVGNAVVDLSGAVDRRSLASAVDRLTPDASVHTSESFLEAFAHTGGIAEEWIEGDEVGSPSVQLRADPMGEVEVLSTHDQILGGPGGQTYLGCRFPALPLFVEPLTRYGRAIGTELARHGVIGRFGIDFVMARRGNAWHPYAIEINLRNGGTTHPMLTLQALTDGAYDEASGRLLARTGPKHYVATDHLERPEYASLTPDDVLDLVEGAGLSWNPGTERGVALHMVSGVAVGGSLGVTAISDSPAEADGLMTELTRTLDGACGAAGVHPGAGPGAAGGANRGSSTATTR